MCMCAYVSVHVCVLSFVLKQGLMYSRCPAEDDLEFLGFWNLHSLSARMTGTCGVYSAMDQSQGFVHAK